MFWQRFSELCEQNHVKPGKVADSCGINRSNVSIWKSRGYIPRPDALKKLADYLNVSTDYLLGNEKSPAIKDDDEAKNSNGERAAEIIDRLPPAKQEEALNYLRFLAQQDSEKK